MHPKDTQQAAVIYAAKSSEDVRGSIPDQLAACREHAEREGWEVVAEHSDEAASAFKGNRGPGLAAAKAQAAEIAGAGRGIVLLVYATDRLARGDGEKAMHLVEHWLEAKKAGYRLAAVTESLDDLLHAALLGERANADSKAKSQWTRAGLRRAAAAGRYHGGRPPYGYRFEGRREERSLVSDPAQAAVVRRIYGAYRAGRGCHRVADDLNADSVQPPRAKKWDRSTIANILDSPVYIGRVPYNDEVFEGEHDPILDAE